jgi:hypothetical protein
VEVVRTRWLLFVLLVLVLGGVAYWRRTREPEPKPPLPPRPVEVDEPWATTVLFERFELSMPRSWFANPEPAMEHGILFRGPPDGIHPPTVQLYWGPVKVDLAGFFEFERERRVPGIQDILEEGDANVAGLPAKYLVYRMESNMPESVRKVEFLTIDWYFVHDGHGGILRGLAPAQTFRLKYRPIFAAIATRLRYRPSR